LKSRRGHARGQIATGVIVKPDDATLHYYFEHRHPNEPLTGHIPILFVCAREPGLQEWTEPKKRSFAPCRFPKSVS
jgi:hypothetical protein